ncbi:MAG: AMP-binding protein, partial [Bacteroidaceae bacterium]|nr:AMP-binding protein [Bacteroidaceae bacterium]
EGWLHTGDLGVIDAEGNLTIKGRSKNMLLSASGQNIYPEEIEDKLNNLNYVSESIIIQRDEKLVALIHPDYDELAANGIEEADIDRIMKENVDELNTMIPNYSKITRYILMKEEFEKTPKKSIKRYLYQNAGE